VLENIVQLAVLAVTFSQQLLYGAILGIVQGISEWLPISSKTQIIIVATYLLKLSFNNAYAFGLFMEIGTILAAIIYFRNEVTSAVMALFGRGGKDGRLMLKYLVISTVFTGVIGCILYLFVDSLEGAYNLGLPMAILGLILIGDAILIRYSRSKHRKNPKAVTKTLSNMTAADCAIVGIVQGIAALPGVSRSGITTSALLLMGVKTDEAFRLSFISMILATTGAVALTLIASRASIASSVALIGTSGILVSIIVATAVSLVFMRFLLDMARRSSIVYLVLALGIIALVGGVLTGVYYVP
jgi:undecaprenyl-diphosphatase